MITLDLNGSWKLRKVGDPDWTNAIVPGSVLMDLLNAGRIEDPFYRENEDQTLALLDNDFEFVRTFIVPAEALACEDIRLACDGLDTLCTLYVNDVKIAETENMHRAWHFPMRDILRPGENVIRAVFASAARCVAEKNAEYPLRNDSGHTLVGFGYLRKGHSMLGWDWGPILPDAGIWKDIRIECMSDAVLEDVKITQRHAGDAVKSPDEDAVQAPVDLTIRISAECFGQEAYARVTLTAPCGTVKHESVVPLDEAGPCALLKPGFSVKTTTCEKTVAIRVENPEIWWPNGYGKQPLYALDVALVKPDGVGGYQALEAMVLDAASGKPAASTGTLARSFRIGLRTLTVRQEKDEWGESFAFCANGHDIFSMGANWIPEDNILARRSPEKTRRLLEDCVAANYNTVRVWGGGVYPEDTFMNDCDELGLIVWQDHMFACAAYRMTPEFEDSIRHEIRDNVRRMRHHASLGIWCGNNEIETAWVDWAGFCLDPVLKADYIKQFEVAVPAATKESDDETFFWPSSPSSGGCFDKPNDENRGDVHYWEVWHALKPFTEYRKYFFRFCSEFGFQSFPCMKTIEGFSEPEDRNIFSPVMEKHQKNGTANGRILFYLADTYRYPKDLKSLVHVSQLLQAEAIQYGVEHWRRHRGRCMGAIYWQVNDCWPVASWSSIDWHGRWKALHYYARRFFAPVLVSCEETGERADLHVANETMKSVSGMLTWNLRDSHSVVLKTGSLQLTVDALSTLKAAELDFAADFDALAGGDAIQRARVPRSVYLEYAFAPDGDAAPSTGSILFVKPKHFNWTNAVVSAEITETEDAFQITLSSTAYAGRVELDLAEADAVFSDNWFCLHGGMPVTVTICRKQSPGLTLAALKDQLQVTSMADTF